MAQYDFFISHANEDAEYARKLVAALEARGVKCWIAPRDIPGGSDYGSEIVRAIQASRSMLLIMSAKANEAAHERKHILRELEEASNFRKPIYPLRLEPIELHDSLRYRLSMTQWIEDINDRYKLAELIVNILNKETVAMPIARRRIGFKINSVPGIMATVLVFLFILSVAVPYFSSLYFNHVDNKQAKNRLLGYGYELNSAGIEQAVRKNDMQSVVWFRQIGVRLSTIQIQTLILDDIKGRFSALTPMLNYLDNAGALDEVAKIKRDLREILEHGDALNRVYELSCNGNNIIQFWTKAFKELFGSLCSYEAEFYASLISKISKLVDFSNTNRHIGDFRYKPKNVNNVTAESLRDSPERERLAEFIRIRIIFSTSQGRYFLFTEDGIFFLHSGSINLIPNTPELSCRSENQHATKMCEAIAVLFVPASAAMRRSSSEPLHPNDISNRIKQFLNGSLVLNIVDVIDSKIGAVRDRNNVLVSCRIQPGAGGWQRCND